RRSCEPPRQPIFLATAEHRPGAASRRSLRAYASSGAFQRPLQWLNSLLQGGPLFRGQTSANPEGSFTGSERTGSLAQFRIRRRWMVEQIEHEAGLFFIESNPLCPLYDGLGG